jgi:hypothetical protein
MIIMEISFYLKGAGEKTPVFVFREKKGHKSYGIPAIVNFARR